MKIVKQSESELSLVNRPEVLEQIIVFVVTLIFLVLPLLSSMYEVYRLGIHRLSCQRVEPTLVKCSFSKSHLLDLIKSSDTLLHQVTAAEVKTETRKDSDGKEITNHSVVLYSKSGEITYVRGGKKDFDEIEVIVEKINHFLVSEDSSLTLQWDRRWRNFFLGLIIFLAIYWPFYGWPLTIAAYSAFSSEKMTFNKASKQLCYLRRGLLHRKVCKYPLQDVCDIKVQSKTDGEGNGIYWLQVSLLQGKEDFSPASKAKVDEASSAIKQFLQLEESSSQRS